MTRPAQEGALSARLATRLRPLLRAVRRALWRHVGRFLTGGPPPYGRSRRRDLAADRRPQRR